MHEHEIDPNGWERKTRSDAGMAAQFRKDHIEAIVYQAGQLELSLPVVGDLIQKEQWVFMTVNLRTHKAEEQEGFSEKADALDALQDYLEAHPV